MANSGLYSIRKRKEDNMDKKIISIRKLTDKKYLNLYEGTYLNRDGSQSKWDFASRKELRTLQDVSDVLKERKPNAVNIAVFSMPKGNGEPHVILIREYRSPLGGYMLSFPAGLIEDGEDPETAAKRELYEEIGADPKKAKTRVFTDFATTSAGVSNECNSIVLAQIDPLLGKQHLESDEDIEVMDVTLTEAMRLLHDKSNTFEMSTYLMLEYMACGYNGLHGGDSERMDWIWNI
jgi:ADP-ribose pyrophosphatase